jgi:hypothetical protein
LEDLEGQMRKLEEVSALYVDEALADCNWHENPENKII